MAARVSRLSLRARLALIYTGLLAVALTAFGAGVFVILRGELERSFDAALLASAEHAGGAFALDARDGAIQPSERLLDQLASTGGRVVVLDAAGRTIADSEPERPSLALTAADLEQAGAHRHAIRPIGIGGAKYRLAIERVLAGGELVGFVVWANPTSDLDSLLGTVATALAAAAVVVIAFATALGWLLARRALAPIVDVTDTARAISLSGDFGARVEVANRTDETGELAVAFNEMLAALEQNHHTLQRFLGDASHQLRTPITTIRANLDLARRNDLADSERQAILLDARSEAERMGRLVADLLALARAESGARLEFAPLHLDEVLLESVRQQRQAGGEAVEVAVSTVTPARVAGDRDRLKELFLILLDNAVRYTPPPGRVTAAMELRGGQVEVTIADTGIGISAADAPRLFERLYRGQRARELRPSGTGLGLAIARWIVDAHGGTITLDGRAEGGTTATVRLPAQD